MHAPAYKISKYLAKQLNGYLNLEYQFNTIDSSSLANELTKLKLDHNSRMVTFDIKGLYVNIPVGEKIQITQTQLAKYNSPQITQQTITLLQAILKQNYFAFENKIYQPEKGVSMGSPISNIIAEIFLQNLEQLHMTQILDTNNIVYYTRYVNDILIIYDNTLISLETISEQINKLHPDLQFTHTQEQDNTVNFLDLHLIRHPNTTEIDIYRKTTTTDTTINFTSNHPTEHKLAAYRFLIHRMLSLPLSTKKKSIEWQKIMTVASNNRFPPKIITRLKTQIQQATQRKKETENGPHSLSIAQKSGK